MKNKNWWLVNIDRFHICMYSIASEATLEHRRPSFQDNVVEPIRLDKDNKRYRMLVLYD
jgi:hypothetical protein